MCKENTVSGQPGSRDCIRPVEFQMSMSLLLIGYARPSVGEVDSIMPSGCEMPNRRFVCVCANPMNGPSNRTRTRRIILQRHMCRKKTEADGRHVRGIQLSGRGVSTRNNWEFGVHFSQGHMLVF